MYITSKWENIPCRFSVTTQTATRIEVFTVCQPVVKVGLSFPSLHPYPVPPAHPPVEVSLLNTAIGSGGLGQRPGGNRIWCILALKSDIWWYRFYKFSSELLITVGELYQGRREGGDKGDMSPPEILMLKNRGFAMIISISGGFAHKPPPGLCPWTPLGDFCPPVPLFCPPSKQISGYAPELYRLKTGGANAVPRVPLTLSTAVN